LTKEYHEADLAIVRCGSDAVPTEKSIRGLFEGKVIGI
jgi:hypothetical protein